MAEEYALRLELVVATVLAYKFSDKINLVIDPLSKVFDVALGDDAVGVGLTVWVHGLVHICSGLVDAVARFIDPAAEFKCVHS